MTSTRQKTISKYTLMFLFVSGIFPLFSYFLNGTEGLQRILTISVFGAFYLVGLGRSTEVWVSLKDSPDRIRSTIKTSLTWLVVGLAAFLILLFPQAAEPKSKNLLEVAPLIVLVVALYIFSILLSCASQTRNNGNS